MEDNNTLNEYFKRKIRTLELENKELQSEVKMLKDNNDVNLVEHYMQLRTTLLNEINKLKESKEYNESNYKSENSTLRAEVAHLKKEINKILAQTKDSCDMCTRHTNNENDSDNNNEPQTVNNIPITTTSMNTVDNAITCGNINTNTNGNINNNNNNMFQSIADTHNDDVDDVVNDDDDDVNTNQLPITDTNNVNTYTNTNLDNKVNSPSQYFRGSSIKKDFVPSNNISTEIDYLGSSNDKEKITELEDKVAELELKLKDKESLISEQTSKINDLTFQLNTHNEYAKTEISSWKTKYNSIISSNKALSAQYSSLYIDKTSNYKHAMETNKSELEKKITHLETVLTHKTKDLSLLNDINTHYLSDKEQSITNLQSIYNECNATYLLMCSLYNEHISKMVNNLNKMKSLYFTREHEFISITKYYSDMIDEYAKTLNDNETLKNKIEQQYTLQMKENAKLQKQLTAYTQHITDIKNETTNTKPKTRMKLAQTLQEYNTELTDIASTHNTIQAKLEHINEFTLKMEDKLNLFNSIMSDNSNLARKITALEHQYTTNDPQIKDNELNDLRERIYKLEKESQVKSTFIKDYEEIIKNINSKIKNTKTFSNDEVVVKLKAEITKLTTQINNLNKCKDNIEKFYQTEMKSLIEKFAFVNSKNEELVNTIRKMENDFLGKKETILNLWLLEFKEFKDSLLSVDNIQNIITIFDINGDELTKHNGYKCVDELYQLRNEIKGKDEAFEQLKLLHEKDNQRYMKTIDNYKRSIDKKIEMYDELVNTGDTEVNAVKHAKTQMTTFDKAKLQLVEDEQQNWNKNKDEMNHIITQCIPIQDKQIETFKTQRVQLDNELFQCKQTKDKQLDNIIQQVTSQMKLIKDREEFTVNQLELLQEQFDTYKDEKERVIKVLKMENEQLSTFNTLLNKKNNEHEQTL